MLHARSFPHTLFQMSRSRFRNVTPASRSFLLYGPDMSLPSTISGLKRPPAPANNDDLIPVLIQAGHSFTLYLITHLTMPNSYSQMSLILFSKPLFTAYPRRNVSRIWSEWQENLERASKRMLRPILTTHSCRVGFVLMPWTTDRLQPETFLRNSEATRCAYLD